MDAEAAKYIGAGIACLGMGGAGVGLGQIFGNYLAGALRNPSAADGQFGRLILGFAVTEALGIFSLLVALLLQQGAIKLEQLEVRLWRRRDVPPLLGEEARRLLRDRHERHGHEFLDAVLEQRVLAKVEAREELLADRRQRVLGPRLEPVDHGRVDERAAARARDASSAKARCEIRGTDSVCTLSTKEEPILPFCAGARICVLHTPPRSEE